MTAGSANLDPDQQDEIQRLFGQRYTTVQTNSSIASRRDRRRRGQRSAIARVTMAVPRG